jgi:hypothetical protein
MISEAPYYRTKIKIKKCMNTLLSLYSVAFANKYSLLSLLIDSEIGGSISQTGTPENNKLYYMRFLVSMHMHYLCYLYNQYYSIPDRHS